MLKGWIKRLVAKEIESGRRQIGNDALTLVRLEMDTTAKRLEKIINDSVKNLNDQMDAVRHEQDKFLKTYNEIVQFNHENNKASREANVVHMKTVEGYLATLNGLVEKLKASES